MNKRAFTLIELLVVITIIAILAAILFPVFTQAKAASKKTVAIDNLRQITIASTMYQGDYDDQIVLNFASSPLSYFTWQDLLQPYAKSYGIMFDPVSPYQNQDPVNATDYWASFGMLPEAAAVGPGYPNYLTRQSAWFQNYAQANLNYDGLAGTSIDPFGWAGGNYNTVPGGVPSRTPESIARPAETAMFFTSGNWDGWHGVFGQQVGFGYCGGWGDVTESYYGFQPRHTGGTNTCVVATRATDYGKGMAVVMFADGHAKSLGSSALLQADPNGGGFLRYWWPNQ